MGEKVRLQESLHQPSELAKSIGAIFLPADWRGWSYSHYTQLEMIDELLHPALSAAEQRGRDEQREKDAQLATVSGEQAKLLDRVRLWSKCEDGYPLDEHINNIVTQNIALREQLAQARAENERLVSQLKEWQEDKDTKAGYL